MNTVIENSQIMIAGADGWIVLIFFLIWILGAVFKALGKIFGAMKKNNEMPHQSDEYHKEVFDEDFSNYDQSSPYRSTSKPPKRESALEDFLKELHSELTEEEVAPPAPPPRQAPPPRRIDPEPFVAAATATAATIAASRNRQAAPPPLTSSIHDTPAQRELRKLEHKKFRELEASNKMTPAKLKAQRYEEFEVHDADAKKKFQWRIRDLRTAFIMKEILSAPRCKQPLPQSRSITHQQF